MSVGGKVLVLSVGILGGGAIGFWYKETYWVKRRLAEYREMEETYKQLVQLRKEKESLLRETINTRKL
jgi:hypothetical protein